MLIDFEVFEVEDILELVNNNSLLEERITEANQLIDHENQWLHIKYSLFTFFVKQNVGRLGDDVLSVLFLW